MTQDKCKRKPDIDYPCPWIYKVIGIDELQLRALIAELVGDRPHDLSLSRRSAEGKYTSLRLELTVSDEADRLRIFSALTDHPTVRMVL
jgi:uncharacterized protein